MYIEPSKGVVVLLHLPMQKYMLSINHTKTILYKSNIKEQYIFKTI